MTKKSLKILSIITFLCVGITAFIITSCSKENDTKSLRPDQISTEGLTLKDGALSFETADMFFKTTEKLGSMSHIERDKWESGLGFTSMRKELNVIYDEIINCENDSEVTEIVSKNNDLVILQDGDVIPIIESDAYAAICNRNGVFYVEGIIHKVIGNKIISSEDGSIETINNMLSNLKSSTAGVKVVEYINTSYLKSGECGTIKTAYANNSDWKCDFSIKTYKYYCTGCCGNYYYQDQVNIKIKNYKKNIFGSWKPYNLVCKYQNVGYTIVVPIVTGFDGTHSIFYYSPRTYNYSYANSGVAEDEFNWFYFAGDQVQNSDINTPAFDRVKGEGSNIMLGGVWADIYCGSW